MYIYKCIYDEITGIIMDALVRSGGACCLSYSPCDPAAMIRDRKSKMDLHRGRFNGKIKYRRYYYE